MAETNRLLRLPVADVTEGDLTRLWSQKYGGDVALSMANLVGYVQANIVPSALTAAYSSPSATGFTVTVNAGNTWLILTPAAGYAAGTIILPATPPAGSEVLVVSTQSVTALTVDGNGASGVIGAPTTLAANGHFRLKYDAQGFTWYRVG